MATAFATFPNDGVYREARTFTRVEDADGNQHALTITQTHPEIQGVVVVSAFADNPAVREKLLTAVCTALNLSSARVCVTGSG